MRRVALLCSVLFLAFAASAQSVPVSFGFKGNYLGMSLADFKANNGGFTVWVNTGKPNAFGGTRKKDKRQVPTPLCTDMLRDFPGDSRDLQDDEVLCNASPGAVNSEAKTILGNIVLSEVVYRFYVGRLYAIRIQFPDAEYAAVATAFKEKYGDSPAVSAKQYLNAMGARWKGEELIWHSGKQMIVLTEGPGNGPGQNGLASLSSAVIVDASLLPRGEAPQPLDF